MYFVFIVALTSHYKDQIIAEFVKRGFVISTASRNNSTITDPNSRIIDLLVTHINNTNITSKEIMEEVKNIITLLNAKVHAVIISNGTDVTYKDANFDTKDTTSSELSANKENLN